MNRFVAQKQRLLAVFRGVRCLSTTVKYELPELPYDYGALEPAITGQIMETHYKKHHQTYLTNFNNLNAQYQELSSKNTPENLAKQLSLLPGLKFNGGGHINHSIFWTNLAPQKEGGGEIPTSGILLQQVQKDLKDFETLKATLTQTSLGIQGSGWGWLGYNTALDKLEIVTRSNQDPLVELVPLLGIDVWEHAYYYKYGPARAEYLKNIWSVVNWKNVSERLEKAKSSGKK